MEKTERCEVAIVGAGIAGVSLAASLASHAKVLILEQESQPGYHATGRSAAVYAPSYGPPAIRALTRASRSFFLEPPQGFTPQPLVTPRTVCFVARSDQKIAAQALLDELGGLGTLRQLSAQQTQDLLPMLRRNYAALALCDDSTADLDVDALLQGFLRQAKANGAQLIASARVVQMTHQGSDWRLQLANGSAVEARVVVNAAGAWADELGQLAGGERLGLVPKRRSAAIVDAPTAWKLDRMPTVIDIEEQFYVKPDAGRLLVSPANEDAQAPADAQPEELDIAIGLDRAQRAFDLEVKRIHARWAGLRSFVKDKSPVVGWSHQAPNFFWLAGQGGYGIQSSPALAHLAAAQILGRETPAYIANEGLDLSHIAVSRLAASA